MGACTHKNLCKNVDSAKAVLDITFFPSTTPSLTLHLQCACTNKFLKLLILYKYFNFSIAIRELLISNYLQRQFVKY